MYYHVMGGGGGTCVALIRHAWSTRQLKRHTHEAHVGYTVVHRVHSYAPSPTLMPTLVPTVPCTRRYIDAGVYTRKAKSYAAEAFLKRKRKMKKTAQMSRQAMKHFSAHKKKREEREGSGEAGDIESGEEQKKEEGEGSDGDGDDDGGDGDMFSSFRWGGKSKYGFEPLRYKTEEVGRLRDLTAEKRGVLEKGVRLQVDCMRPHSSVATTVSD